MPIIRVSKKDRSKVLRAIDWKALDAMTDAEVTAAAESDPDNPPASDEMLEAIRFARYVQTVRTSVGLTQADFARAFQIPVGTLRDWEQGRRKPDAPSLAYLKVIHREPKAVKRALEASKQRRASRSRRAA